MVMDELILRYLLYAAVVARLDLYGLYWARPYQLNYLISNSIIISNAPG